MTPLPTNSTTLPPARAPASKADQAIDTASTILQDALKILELLTDVTENVPYLNTITGCIHTLIDIQKAMSDNKKRANELLGNVGEVARIVAQGLQDLDEGNRTTALSQLEVDLRTYQMFLTEICDILSNWTSKSFAQRLWSHRNFPDIADGIERRLDVFREVFSVARLIALTSGQNALDAKVQSIIDKDMRTNVEKWLHPANVAASGQDAANQRHGETGKWLLERAEFKEWIYAPRSLLWLHGISGSGKTVLSSTIIEALRARKEPVVFFYFDTNNSGQRTVAQLLCTLVAHLSGQADSPSKTLSDLWRSHANGQHLPSNSALISEALIPVLMEFTRPVYIVLDALDECSEREKLLDSLNRVLDAVPSDIHLLLTSRPEVPHGTNLVQRGVSLSLEGCVDEDIKSYIIEKLASQGTEWTDKRKDQIRVGLLERSKGMFRLAALQLDRVLSCDGRESQVTKALSEMPTSLESLYDRILQDIADPDMVSTVSRTITWLMFSKRPMKLEEIIDTLAFEFDRQPLQFNPAERMRPKALLAAWGGLVTVLEGTTVKLAHASVNEYFLSAQRPRNLYGHSAFSEQAAHLLIARTCVAYLCNFDRILDDKADVQRYPLALYAAENWAFHARFCDEIRLVLGRADEIMQMPGGGKNAVIRATDSHIYRPTELIEAILELLRRESAQYISLCRLNDLDEHWWEHRGFSRSAPILPPLYMSAWLGIGQVVQELLRQGDHVNEPGGRYSSALQAACYQGHIDVVRLLIKHGADVNVQGGEYGNALQATSYEGNIDVLHLLIEHGADVNMQGGEYGNALQAASYRGHIDVVHLLIKRGADMNAQGGEYSTTLQAVSSWGHTNVARLLIECGADVNAQGGEDGTTLQAASSWGRTDVARLLIERGADVNAQGGEYGNALQAASYWGHTDVARLLIEHGADVNAQGGEYGNALQAASYWGHTDVARLLIEHGADVNAQGGQYGNALQAASTEKDSDVACLLIEHGADVNTQGGKYGNALQAASQEGNIDVVHLLIEHGADVNAQGGKYGNSLQAASYWRYTDVARLLIERGADVNAQGGEYGTALQAASYWGHTDVACLLIEHGADVNLQGGEYGTALQAASYWGRIDVARLLIKHGVDVNVQGGKYGNALQAASHNGNIDVARLLIDHGADVNAQGGEYSNTLQAASYRGHTDVVHLLIEHGVDVNAQGGKYGNALQAALEKGHTVVAQLLSESGAVGIPA
ncbi:ankyrin repeat-containing domain protein [Mycena latifolia]|nr:ankyrin repeat-containing domain protein [Mycena latifolia]